jgi:hypothetical protein
VCGTLAPILFDLSLHVRQPRYHSAVEVEHREQALAAGTCGTTILTGPRETVCGGPDHGGGGVRYAGTGASQAKIGLVRHQQRHKADPEYSPENHVMPFCAPHSEHRAGAVPSRLGVFLKLKLVARFCTQAKRKPDRIVSLQFKKTRLLNRMKLKV